MDQKLTLGYWSIRGRGQIPRLLLAYTGAVWQDLRYTEPDQWFEGDKKQLQMNFPNLPYIIDGDYKLTQTTAVNRYIIQRSNKKELLGKDIRDQGKVNQLISFLTDIETKITGLFFSKEWDKVLPDVLKEITPKLDQIQNYFGTKEFALGYLTLFDFILCERSYYLEKLSPETYEKYPFLKKCRNAFNSLPQIKKYYDQPTSMKQPFLPGYSMIKF